MNMSVPKATHTGLIDHRAADIELFRRLVTFAALANVVLVGLVISNFVMGRTLFGSHTLIYSSTISAFALLGLIYCLFLWTRRQSSRPLFALQIALLIPSLSVLLLSFDAQIGSIFFSIWLGMVIVLSLTGKRSFELTIPLTIAYVVTSWTATNGAVQDNQFLTMTIGTFVSALLIAETGDRSMRTMQMAEGLSNRLDGAEMQEQLMMSAIADAVVAVDVQRRVVIFNEAAQRVTGWDEKSALTIDYNLIFKLKDASDGEVTENNDPFAMVIRTKQAQVSNDFYMPSKDGARIAFSISIAPTLDSKGQVSGAIGIFHDISAQQAVARERNEFVSTASHEMRTPVAAIEGYISMAMNPKLAQVDERAKGFLVKAHESSIHLGKLFKNLLSVTKIEDGRMAMNIRNFNITELIGQVVNEMTIIAAAKGLTIDSQVGGAGNGRERVVAPLYKVIADPDRVREVMANLIDNAIKYSPKGAIQVKAETDKDFVTISITDHGVGISLEDQKHLFQKFYRANSSMTREVGGSGLGLYIARNLIERCGGRISVESEMGVGSTFKFTLPLAKY